MKRILIVFLLLTIILIPPLIKASLFKNSAEKKIDAILSSPLLKKVKVAIKAQEVFSGKVIYEKNSQELLKPASTVKIITTSGALKYLHPDYTFKTKLYTDGKISGDVLKGNLYLKGGGDPFLVSERIWYLINDLKREGFKKVSGDLIVDNSYFDSVGLIRDRPQSSQDRAYEASLGALSVNFNSTCIYVRPGEKIGKLAKVIIDPDLDYIKVKNEAKTSLPSSKINLEVRRISEKLNDIIKINGVIPLGHKEMRYYRNISSPSLYAGLIFKKFLKNQGIEIRGKVKDEQVPQNSQELLTYESPPLSLVTRGLNKFSNNFVAEQILKTLGAEFKSPPGSTDKGIETLAKFMQQIGIENNYKIVNGSGLSHANLLTADQLVRTLRFAYQDFEIGPAFIDTFGIAGIDGTLEKWFRGTPLVRNLRAKTGRLDGVAALAGYLNNKKNIPIAFSIIFNDPKGKDHEFHLFEQKICLTLYNDS